MRIQPVASSNGFWIDRLDTRAAQIVIYINAFAPYRTNLQCVRLAVATPIVFFLGPTVQRVAWANTHLEVGARTYQTCIFVVRTNNTMCMHEWVYIKAGLSASNWLNVPREEACS